MFSKKEGKIIRILNLIFMRDPEKSSPSISGAFGLCGRPFCPITAPAAHKDRKPFIPKYDILPLTGKYYGNPG